MSIKIKQKSESVIMVRCNNPMEIKWVLNQWARMKQMPPAMHPQISVKDLKGNEINLPPPQMMPSTPSVKVEQKPVVTITGEKPPMTPVGGLHPDSMPTKQASQPDPEPVKPISQPDPEPVKPEDPPQPIIIKEG